MSNNPIRLGGRASDKKFALMCMLGQIYGDRIKQARRLEEKALRKKLLGGEVIQDDHKIDYAIFDDLKKPVIEPYKVKPLIGETSLTSEFLNKYRGEK